MTRRSFFLKSVAGAAGLAAFKSAAAETGSHQSDGFKPAELDDMEATAEAFMKRHKVPGLSVAIANEERLVYAKGYGLADQATGERLNSSHLLRIASVSKPFTSATIFRLIEAGRLRLSDRVFGPHGVLGTQYGKPPYRQHVGDITVEHLLMHTAGGWQNDGNDPMFSHTAMGHKQLITWTIANRLLQHPPGRHYAYSNFGYCVLGRVIEKVTGKSYPAAVEEQILAPCGITGMRIGGNTLAERAANEVVYYDQDGESPYGMNVHRMDSHGGWLATPTDLTRFLVRVDDFPAKRDILEAATIHAMTTGSTANAGYAKGWCVNRYNNWWHAGSLPGTSSIMVRTAGRFCWGALANTRKMNSNLGEDLDQLMWQMISKITSWPSYDLFG